MHSAEHDSFPAGGGLLPNLLRSHAFCFPLKEIKRVSTT